MRGGVLESILVIGIILGVAVSIWLHFLGPCDASRFSATRDVPARCIAQYSR